MLLCNRDSRVHTSQGVSYVQYAQNLSESDSMGLWGMDPTLSKTLSLYLICTQNLIRTQSPILILNSYSICTWLVLDLYSKKMDSIQPSLASFSCGPKQLLKRVAMLWPEIIKFTTKNSTTTVENTATWQPRRGEGRGATRSATFKSATFKKAWKFASFPTPPKPKSIKAKFYKELDFLVPGNILWNSSPPEEGGPPGGLGCPGLHGESLAPQTSFF